MLFLVTMGISLLILQSDTFDRAVVMPYRLAVTSIAGYCLGMVGIDHAIEADIIVLKGTNLRVDRSCTGVFAVFALCSAVVSYPSRTREKLLGCGLGILVIFFFNIVRVLSLCLLGIFAPHWIGPVHNIGWQILMIFIILVLWLFWEEKIVRD